MTVLDTLDTAYTDRFARARAWRADGGTVVGYVGADTPVELVTAAGALPVRLSGRPGRPLGHAREYLGAGVDPATLSILAGLLDEAHPLDLLLVSHDSEASLQLFYALRELRRLGLEPQLPPTWLVDVLHLPHRSTATYNLVRLRELRSRLERFAGATIDADALAAAVATHEEIRSARRVLATLRAPGRRALTGVEALTLVGAGSTLPAGEYLPLLRAALAELAGRAPRPGVPLLLTGSAHDEPGVYRSLEDDGWLIVGEDHSWGDGAGEPPLTPPTLEGLAEWYQGRTVSEAAPAAVARTGAEGVLSYARTHDDAPLWDFRALAAAVPVPAALVAGQEYGTVDLAAVRAELKDGGGPR
ncbi:2-hydroxyacyl-CoA dehydratase family protein [Cryptosporangium arvum]|uniref:Benzoyl-CoA reductase/2-hydroxyglutaryl-CoA dehydratase subunit, BcrC/BadD/HgdB n=1 Tax=Cryptosporangium arvum DSM 44712 TaxID=927661 RepID=A0A010Z5U9_9ACTN|nr:2-hydroxyacyl-CoA dehydratase family protein [Cryptosporangium arvum]EXG82703.1 Benzoyl-CoA reductase/2-hydroxyglutaryl-CoA dehydratase subunit, BcrC/BadD/HgdB [Cryptosporangium arvum DSM 44712]